MARDVSQDADDMICRAPTFKLVLPDGSIAKTFNIRQQCQLNQTASHGDMVVWETLTGDVFIKIEESS